MFEIDVYNGFVIIFLHFHFHKYLYFVTVIFIRQICQSMLSDVLMVTFSKDI